MECFMYEDIRVDLFEKVSVKNPQFHTMTTMENSPIRSVYGIFPKPALTYLREG
jgi:hypothetical protein